MLRKILLIVLVTLGLLAAGNAIPPHAGPLAEMVYHENGAVGAELNWMVRWLNPEEGNPPEIITPTEFRVERLDGTPVEHLGKFTGNT